ncbi:MAG: ribosome small subunit-dependent GTPase A [Candidatus Aminicenantes bacterium]|nr:ribosome small subunit-dependent GTPase A [Candidatus Aminicenantes bacterium]
MDLIDFGWDDYFAAHFGLHAERGLVPARVVKQHRDRSILAGPGGEWAGEVSGRFRHLASGRADYPVVGDWVVVEPGGAGPALIQGVLPRRSAFRRKVAGDVVEAQVVAANIDTVFLVSGLDGDFSPRRIERYLTTAWDGGASPVVVLNKADLRDDLEDVILEVEKIAPGTPVVTTSALAGGRLDALQPYLVPRKTVALLGSSGVGKSTLINRLLGEERFPTAPIIDVDGRGRHTTTARELVALPGGALLIDTPGMRELQLWADDESLGRSFDDIEELAARCRFADCSHENEPGCAVRAAAADGALDAGRLEGFFKLRRELRFLALKQDVRARRQAEKAFGRRVATYLKDVYKHKRGFD